MRLNWHIQDFSVEIHQVSLNYTVYAGLAEATRQIKIKLCVCQNNNGEGVGFDEEKTLRR